MTEILATNDQEVKELKNLLAKQFPTHRKAYSDRTAWLMACCSELAYVKFNPLLPKSKQKAYFLKHIEKLLGKEKKSAVIELIELLGYDHEEEKHKLILELQLLEMQLLETYSKDTTQAILLSYDDYVILAFRGTEPTSVKDIRADAKGIKVKCDTGGYIHQGFKEAYELVADDIKKRLDQEDCKDKLLFITGHSLGGALATVATKALDHRGKIAACYTFGSPRVGDTEWVGGIKDPIYRVVNAADAVTMLPPGDTFVSVLGWFTQFLPRVGNKWRTGLLENFGGYLHGGDMRYLESVPKGQFEKVKLLYSVSLYYRLKGLFFMNRLSWTHLMSDHSIAVYRKKLTVIANKRNPDLPDKDDQESGID